MLRTIVRVLVMSPRPALVSTAALGLGLLLGIAAGATGAVQPERHAKHLVTNAFRGATAWEAPSAARGLVPASQADTAYTDPTGDATGGSPDVRATVVTNDATGIVTFRVAVAGVPAADTWVDIYFDVDRNTSTGDDDGDEYNIYLRGSDTATGAARFDGSSSVNSGPCDGTSRISERNLVDLDQQV